MINTSVIKRFEDIIKVGTTLKHNWFRGHSSVFGQLTSGVHREPYKCYADLGTPIEFVFAEEFKTKAPRFMLAPPAINNNLEWLFLMQHHGTPTRLLDWSESILIATFFAVADEDRDGEIWTVYPQKLNALLNCDGIPLIDKDMTLRFLVDEIFHLNPNQLAIEYDLDKVPDTPMALLPPSAHPRMTSQLSCFTIHPKPKVGKTIPCILTDDRDLMRYIIPKECKKKFKGDLESLGITYSSIFPDLDGLSKTLKYVNTSARIFNQPQALYFED